MSVWGGVSGVWGWGVSGVCVGVGGCEWCGGVSVNVCVEVWW